MYFPAGTYVVSTPIVPYYFTQMVGDATDRPTIKPSNTFSGLAVVDADPYFTQDLNWVGWHRSREPLVGGKVVKRTTC